MTVDPGSAGRDGGDDVGVTVIDDVDEVGPMRRATDFTGQEKVAVDEPIDVEGESPGEWKSQSPKRRRDVLGGHGVRKVPEQFVRTQVHARPSFISVVADHGESHQSTGGLCQITVNLMPLVVRDTSGQSRGTGGELSGHMFASSTNRSPPGLILGKAAVMQLVR